MSKIIASAVIRASHDIVNRAEDLLNKVMADKGESYAFEFPDTAFCLPMIMAMTGYEIKTLGQMREGATCLLMVFALASGDL